jgi:methyl-accepting chemotaxis protein
MRIPQLRISQRLASGFGVILALFAISVATTMVLNTHISTSVDLVTAVRVPTAISGMTLSEQVTTSVADLRGYLLTNNDERRKSWENTWRRIQDTRQDIDQKSASWTSAKNRELWVQVKPVIDELQSVQQRVIVQFQANDKDGAIKLLGSEAIPRVAAIADLLYGPLGSDGKRSGGMISNQRVLMDKDIANVQQSQDNLELTLWITLAVGIAAGAALALVTTRSIVRPLGGITNTMEHLTQGNLTVEVPGTARQD